jgi:hypothetical protein
LADRQPRILHLPKEPRADWQQDLAVTFFLWQGHLGFAEKRRVHRPSPPLIEIRRLWHPMYQRANPSAAEAKFFAFSEAFLDFRSKPGRERLRGGFRKSERKTGY